jgi:hypothetical protein
MIREDLLLRSSQDYEPDVAIEDDILQNISKQEFPVAQTVSTDILKLIYKPLNTVSLRQALPFNT